MQQAFVGIDVGTSSARAGIFDENGTLLATARHPITVWHEAGSVVEQSSAEIWAACATSVRAAMAEARSAKTSAAASVSMCPASARSAREWPRIPATTSPAITARTSSAASVRALRSASR